MVATKLTQSPWFLNTFLTMIGVSLRDTERPAATEETMLALHGPEGLGLEALRVRSHARDALAER